MILLLIPKLNINKSNTDSEFVIKFTKKSTDFTLGCRKI